MDVIAHGDGRWTLTVCDQCGGSIVPGYHCKTSDGGQPVKVEVVLATQLQGAVEALEQIRREAGPASDTANAHKRLRIIRQLARDALGGR